MRWQTIPSRRAIVIFALNVVVVAGLAVGLTTKFAVKHYQAEHASAVRALGGRDAFMVDNNRQQQLAEGRLKAIQRLETRLANDGNDLRYAVTRWHALQRKVAGLRIAAATLRDEVAVANKTAKNSYDTGYQAGLADGSSTLSPGGEAPAGDCDPNYEGACIPAGYADVDCGEILETDFDVVGYDIYGLDGDEDGIACESY